MFDLSPYRVLIAVFGMPECPACEAYIPRLVERVEALRAAGAKISIYDPTSTTPVPTDSALVVIYDVSSEDASVQTFADRLNIAATPTTVILLRGAGMSRFEGGLANGHIDQVLQLALSKL